MAEMLVWGEQHDTKFFEEFIELNVLQVFVTLLTT
jgi:hypothetical protein